MMMMMILDTNLNGLNSLTSFGSLALAIGFLLNVGGLAWWIRSGTDMKLAQRDATEAKAKADDASTRSHVLESRVNQQDTIINEIRTRMSKLDKVDEMVAAVDYIKDAIAKHLVPRSELERQWKADEERMERTEESIRDLKEQVNSHAHR